MIKRLCVLASFGIWSAAHAQPGPVKIVLPDLLAVELPRGAADIGPQDPPLRALLESGKSGALKVSADLSRRVGAGPVSVTWSAMDAAGKTVASRTAAVFVLPFGMTPIGTSGDENATAGNNAAHIVRDSQGLMHMVWADSGGPTGRAGAVYRRASIAEDGTVTLETPPIYVAEAGPSDWNSYPALAADGDAVQLVWQGGGSVYTRRAAASGALGPIVDTKARSAGRDVGPAIVADPQGLHLATPEAVYARSTDGGMSWRTEKLPVPAGQQLKTVSLAPGEQGSLDVAFSSVAYPLGADTKSKGSGGWWQLRTIRRLADGSWTDPQDALSGFLGWGSPKPDEDALVDWIRVAPDGKGGLHAVWHGTAASRIYGNDSSYYAWRNAAGAWQSPVLLVPQDTARGVKFSFAPSLAVGPKGAVAVSFYDIVGQAQWYGFDSTALMLDGGRTIGAPVPVSQSVAGAVASGHPELALSTRFPAVAPTIRRSADGHAWLDVLETLIPAYPGSNGKLIVYHRVDVTASLPR